MGSLHDRSAAPSIAAAPDPGSAARMLANWGFLAEPDLPDRPGPAFLLVALRDRPTLRHFDPELVEFWVTEGGRGVRRTLTRESAMPLDVPFSWGLIRIVDRLGVSNEYVTFGGRLQAARIYGMTIAVLTSEVPLLRRGGHSQVWDEAASTLAAYPGRLLLAVDIEPGDEGRAAAATPATRYAAFIDDLLARYRASAALRDHDPTMWQLLRSESTRIQRQHPDAWARRTDLRWRVSPPVR